MRSPFRSEATAFRLVVVTLVVGAAAAAAVAVAGAAATAILAAPAVAVAIVLSRGRRRPPRLLRTAPPHTGSPGERRLLVLAQAPLPDGALAELGGRGDRLLVLSSPAAPPLRRWFSDLGDADEQARLRVDATVTRLRALEADATGKVGDADPLQALEDALRTFGGDAIVVSTPRGGRGAALAGRIRERYALPVTHVAG